MKQTQSWTFLALLLLLVMGLATPEALRAGDDEKAVLKLTSDSDEAKAQFKKGLYNHQNIFFVKAAEHFAKALEADPNFGLAKVMHAASAPGLQSADRLAGIEDGLAMMGGASTPELLLATSFHAAEVDDDDGSLKAAEAAAALVPDDPYVAFYAAWGLPIAERVAALEKVVEVHPDFAAAYNILAYDSWNLRNEREALEYAGKYVKAAPDHPNPYDTYGEILQWSGMLSKAAKNYEKAVQLNPDYAAGYAGLADVYQMMGKGDAARAQLDKAIENAPSEPQRLNFTRQKGHSYLHDGDYKSAAKVLGEVATGAEAAGVAWLVAASHATLAAADAVMGKGKDVSKHLEAAEASGGMAPWMHILKFIALSQSGDDAGAAETLAAFKEATNPTTGLGSVAHALNAMVELKAGEHDAALESALASGVDNGLERTIMAKCHAASGNTAEAAGFKAAVVHDTSWSLNGTIEPILDRMLADV